MLNRSSDFKTAIIILNWNGWQDTIECLDSVYKIINEEFKVFLVDNNSQDDSIDRLREAYPNLDIIVSEKNLGFSGGNNLAINLAMQEGYDYFWLLNNDTTVNSMALRALLDKAMSRSDYGIIGSIIIEYYNPTKVQAWGGGRINKSLGLTSLFNQPVKEELVEHILGASMFIPRKVIEDVGGLDDAFFFFMEDTDLSLRIAEKYRIGVSEKSFVFHKGGSSLKSKDRHKNITADTYFSASVGFFMYKYNIKLVYVLARFLLIIFNRIRKLEFDRIYIISKSFIDGYRGRFKITNR